jgi:hypothetical protein
LSHKNLDDDDIENAIQVMFHDLALVKELPEEEMGTFSEDLPLTIVVATDQPREHGRTVDGLSACCAKVAESAVDCDSCLRLVARNYFSGLDAKKSKIAQQILDVVQATGTSGISKHQLLVSKVQPIMVFH